MAAGGIHYAFTKSQNQGHMPIYITKTKPYAHILLAASKREQHYKFITSYN